MAIKWAEIDGAEFGPNVQKHLFMIGRGIPEAKSELAKIFIVHYFIPQINQR